MIFFVGDIHGQVHALERLLEFVEPTDTVIQVGDFGFNENFILQLTNRWRKIGGYPCPILAIDGNHENFKFLNEIKWIHVNSFSDINVHYVSRGTVLEIEDKLFGFLGGADSVDVYWRTENYNWWKEERITEYDLETLYKNVDGRQLDVLVTHCPPPQTIRENLVPLNKESWHLPNDWRDVSSEMVGKAILETNPRKVVCGHVHRSVKHGKIRILDIDEIISYDDL